MTSIAAFWLAAKLEEVVEIDRPDRLRLRDVLTTFHRLLARAAGSPVPPRWTHSARYAELKAAVVRDERHLLRALGFVIGAEQPHRFVLNYGALVLGAGAAQGPGTWPTTRCTPRCASRCAPGSWPRGHPLPWPRATAGHPAAGARPSWQPLGATTQQVHAVAAALCRSTPSPGPVYRRQGARGSGGPARGAAARVARTAEEGLETDAVSGRAPAWRRRLPPSTP